MTLLTELKDKTARLVRLLIADDVGIGKTIEAGLILREFIDRGEADRFAVLCPPHLVEQWTGELNTKDLTRNKRIEKVVKKQE